MQDWLSTIKALKEGIDMKGNIISNMEMCHKEGDSLLKAWGKRGQIYFLEPSSLDNAESLKK
jgi:hypothetical protein